MWVVLCCVVMQLRQRGVMVDGVLIQCVSLVCGSLLAFLLSVCTYVCVVYGFNLYVSGCVLVVPEVVC